MEVDIRRFFDNDHGHLRTFLRLWVRDGVLLHLISNWLNWADGSKVCGSEEKAVPRNIG